MSDFGVLLPLTALMIALFGLILSVGGIFVYRGSRNKGLSELDAKTITSLQAQNEAQEKQIHILEKKIARCEGVISTLQFTLKSRRGLLLEVNGELITITDTRTGAEQSVKIKIDSGELKEE